MAGNRTAPVPVRHFGLRFDHPADQPEDYPVVTILIDGQDSLALARPGYQGFDPDDILGAESPLLPVKPGRRVAVYRCSCGEPGCGVIAPRITHRTDGHIIWTDFRDYTGVFAGPTVADEPGGGDHIRQASLLFDAQQYTAEVARANADRSWESERRCTARLLRQTLAASRHVLLEAGYNLHWVGPMPNDDKICEISLTRRTPTRDQLLLELTAPAGTPAQRAQAMADLLLGTPTAQWPTMFTSRRRP
jgi:hypothetical protein